MNITSFLKKNLAYLYFPLFVLLGILIITFIDNSKISDLIQFGILLATILVMYIPLNKQFRKEQEYQEIELDLLSKQLLSIVDYIEQNFANKSARFAKESIVKEKRNELKSMISELNKFDKKVLKKGKCELVDPSYSKLKLFDIYEIGTDGISKFEYNEGYNYKKFHVFDPEIIKYLRARIKRF